MAVLKCDECNAKVESNRCCGEPMGLEDETLSCKSCNKQVNVNKCCGHSMKEMKGE